MAAITPAPPTGASPIPIGAPWTGIYNGFVVRYVRTWRATVFSSFASPVLYLLAMGYGLGKLVNHGASTGASAALPHGVTYLEFLAPGLLAASLMQLAAQECTFPVFAAIKWLRLYDAALASPADVRAIVVGQQAWVATRMAANAVVFVAVMSAFGASHSAWVIAVIPAGVLTGMAFSAPITAFAARVQHESAFSGLFRFGVLPLFLFSGTFFPISQLPAVLRPIAWVSPLWHGVDLCRTLALGDAGPWRSLLHVAVLAAWFVVGLFLAFRTHRARLAQ
jgi:lipooligosaccharide transport system permease protein